MEERKKERVDRTGCKMRRQEFRWGQHHVKMSLVFLYGSSHPFLPLAKMSGGVFRTGVRV